jgi:hypothetical protein
MHTGGLVYLRINSALYVMTHLARRRVAPLLGSRCFKVGEAIINFLEYDPDVRLTKELASEK